MFLLALILWCRRQAYVQECWIDIAEHHLETTLWSMSFQCHLSHRCLQYSVFLQPMKVDHEYVVEESNPHNFAK